MRAARHSNWGAVPASALGKPSSRRRSTSILAPSSSRSACKTFAKEGRWRRNHRVSIQRSCRGTHCSVPGGYPRLQRQAAGRPRDIMIIASTATRSNTDVVVAEAVTCCGSCCQHASATSRSCGGVVAGSGGRSRSSSTFDWPRDNSQRMSGVTAVRPT